MHTYMYMYTDRLTHTHTHTHTHNAIPEQHLRRDYAYISTLTIATLLLITVVHSQEPKSFTKECHLHTPPSVDNTPEIGPLPMTTHLNTCTYMDSFPITIQGYGYTVSCT